MRPKDSDRPRPTAGGRRRARPDAPRSTARQAKTQAPDTEEPVAASGPAVDDGQPPPGEPGFPIVGIGASAGGLEALEQLLGHVPGLSGMAFVVVQHLDPTHKDAMVELLQRVCAMPVLQAKDHQTVERDHVYVIPPNKDLSILHGVLHLLPKAAPRGFNLPIDFFFRALAEDQQARGIGVILSGMGSDGTLGLRAIKEKNGACFVQALSSAKFDGMPRSAIEAGLADVVAPAEELAAQLVAYRQHALRLTKPELQLEEKQQTALEKVFLLLRTQTGNDFSRYKRSTIYRRIERRMGLHQIARIADYVRYLRENPRETELLFRELLIGVTRFFRDPPAWERLAGEALPPLVQARARGGVLRAWVPGCSTGEEAYSLAIVLKETIERLAPSGSLTLQVFATDLDQAAIEQARQGLYPAGIGADVSPGRLDRFFVQEDRGYRVGKEIREAVVFAPQNLIMDPPFTRLDLLSCRNLLIYLSAELQKKLIPLFHYSLNPGGVLFLGSAETVGAFSGLFGTLDGGTRIYRRLETAVGAPAVDFPSASAMTSSGAPDDPDGEPRGAARPRTPVPNLQALADRVIVQRFAPATVLTSDQGDILYISGRTGKYLEPAVGKANLNVFAMAREGLRFELSSAFATALREGRTVTVRGIPIGTNGGTQTVDLTVQPLSEPRELRGTVMIVLADVPTTPEPRGSGKGRPASGSTRLARLERELRQAREEIEVTREEMQISQEQLKLANEELQSTNEELQSSNEELTTSKEEMQSMNEELQTVNHELELKVDELSRSSNDMRNLLDSTDIATLFLDGDLRVRRFTTPTARLIKLIPTDAGRPITDIASELDYPDLVADAQEVLRTLVFRERHASSRDGRWFLVRILPYRTLENRIDGVVITFSDTTSAKLLEATLREQASQLRQMAESLPTLVWGAHPDGACNYLSQQWVEYTGVPEAAQVELGWLEQVHPEDREPVRQAWRSAVDAGTALNTEFRIRARSGAFRWFKMRSVPIRDKQGTVVKWYGTATEVDDLAQAAESRKQAAVRLSSILEGLSEAFFALDDGLTVTYVNAAAERTLERRRDDLLGKPLQDAFPELADAAFEERCREAIRERRVLSFEARVEHAPHAGRYPIRVHPHAHGISVFFQRQDDARAAGTDEEGAP